MNKTLSNEIKKRSKLRNKYLRKQMCRRSAKIHKTKKFMHILIKKDKKELLFDLKRKKRDR